MSRYDDEFPVDPYDPYAAARNLLSEESDYSESDGDQVGPPQPAPEGDSFGGLGSPLPPWHLWGNSQTITVPVETVGALRFGNTGQLIKIAYKRPESWHWLFNAKLISGPANTPTFFTRVFVHWDLITGVGRTNIPIISNPQAVPNVVIRGFEEYVFKWGPVTPDFPTNAQIYSTQANAPPREYDADGPFPDTGPPISEIVAQDLQLAVRVVALTVVDNVAAVGQPVTVEVSAVFAPKTHVRPDWYNVAPPQVVFAGGETGGS